VVSEASSYEIERVFKSSELRIAGILDELSEMFFPHVCKFLNLDAGNWRTQVEQFSPQILFVESIWNGFKGTWRRKLTPIPSEEFLDLLKWCRDNNIPTIFWNKEDPVHFSTFLHVASHFDYVLTTDLDCVPLYKRLLGHEQVYCMPFASCVQIYSPIEKYERVNAACFAGSYYNKHEERKRDFEGIMDLLIDKGEVVIYDRNPYPNNPDYTYPEKYRSYIAGTLPPEKVDIAYKSYKIGVTLNIVKHSSTMEARRAFELISCNTLILSNECQGLKTLFGDLVIFYDNPDTCASRLEHLLKNEVELDKLRLQALRKVLSEHTYNERVDFLYELIYRTKPQDSSPRIAVYSVVKDTDDINNVVGGYLRQRYHQKKLFLFSDNWERLQNEVVHLNDVQILAVDQMTPTFLEEFDFCSFFSPNNYYGGNFLTDLTLSLKYEKPTAVGKGCYYTYKNNVFELKDKKNRYILTTSLKMDRAIVSVSYKRNAGFFGYEEGGSIIEGVPCLSIDPFNFCEWYKFETCKFVEDLDVYTGLSMEEINEVSELIKPENKYYKIPITIKESQLFNITRTVPGVVEKILTIDGHTGLFGIAQTVKSTSVFLQKNFQIDEVTNAEGIVYVYINAVTNDDSVRMYCSFYDKSDRYLGKFLVLNRGCTAIRKKENSNYFKLSLELGGNSQVILKEISLNPVPMPSILLLDSPVTKEEKQWTQQ